MAKIDYPAEMGSVTDAFLSCWPKRTLDDKPCQIIVQTTQREFTLEPGNSPDFENLWADARLANGLHLDARVRLLNALPALTIKDRTITEVENAPEP